jgi:colicin import membrane protein
MRPHSSSAYLTSLILHGFVAALIALSAAFIAKPEAMPKIIELVAGPATDMNSLEAPAEGVPDPIKVNVPTPKVVTPPEPQPQAPVEQTPSVPEPVTKPVPKPEPVKAPPTKAKSELSLAQQVKKSAKMSYQDFLKKNPIPKQSAVSQVREARVPRVDTKGIVGGVKGGSTSSKGGQGGNAMTREEADQLTTYISFLLQELKKAHEPPPGVSDRLECRVTFDITASGAILNARITRSSGNREFDESVLEAFRRMRSIGPTPNRRPDTWTVNFRMRDDS